MQFSVLKMNTSRCKCFWELNLLLSQTSSLSSAMLASFNFTRTRVLTFSLLPLRQVAITATETRKIHLTLNAKLALHLNEVTRRTSRVDILITNSKADRKFMPNLNLTKSLVVPHPKCEYCQCQQVFTFSFKQGETQEVHLTVKETQSSTILISEAKGGPLIPVLHLSVLN
jgi:hypothetical protein